jgi:hypothetical protein
VVRAQGERKITTVNRRLHKLAPFVRLLAETVSVIAIFVSTVRRNTCTTWVPFGTNIGKRVVDPLKSPVPSLPVSLIVAQFKASG